MFTIAWLLFVLFSSRSLCVGCRIRCLCETHFFGATRAYDTRQINVQFDWMFHENMSLLTHLSMPVYRGKNHIELILFQFDLFVNIPRLVFSSSTCNSSRLSEYIYIRISWLEAYCQVLDLLWNAKMHQFYFILLWQTISITHLPWTKFAFSLKR